MWKRCKLLFFEMANVVRFHVLSRSTCVCKVGSNVLYNLFGLPEHSRSVFIQENALRKDPTRSIENKKGRSHLGSML
jgi:hypothetical protein